MQKVREKFSSLSRQYFRLVKGSQELSPDRKDEIVDFSVGGQIQVLFRVSGG